MKIRWTNSYDLFSVVASIFDREENTMIHTTDDFTHLELRLCEENSTDLETEVLHGMVYIVYHFVDKSKARLLILPTKEVTKFDK